MASITSSNSPLFDFIYLASQSPRRRELLTQIGVAHALLLPDENEDAEGLEVALPQEIPQDYVQRVTLAKLGAAMARHSRRGLSVAPILCSDTTVALGNKILGKPENPQHACEMLAELQGGVHQVYSAVVIALPQASWEFKGIKCAVSVSDVILAPMSVLQIQRYVQSGEPMGKAGAYGIQGRMAAYVKHIAGSYSGIMGLPLFETAQLLERWQIKRN